MDARVPPRSVPDEVTALYQSHALGLVRLAVIMLGDRGAAEDVVQEAFLGLYRHWGGLSDTSNALAYVRTMRISRGTVRSATSRAIATLGRMIREDS